MRPTPSPLAAVLLSALALSAQATPSLTTVGNLAYTCSGAGNGNAYNGIDLQNGFFAGQVRCREAQTLPAKTAKARRGYTGPHGGIAQGGGKARFGKAQVDGSSTTLDNEAHQAVAGFVDRWTVQVPGLDEAAPLMLTVRLRVRGQGEAHGASGSAGIGALVFRDGGVVGSQNWGMRSEPAHPDVQFSVDEAWTASMLLNNIRPFHLAAVARSSTGAAAMNSTGSAAIGLPAASITWDGVVELRDYWTGQLYTNWTLQTDSGVDWRNPCPCPLP